MEYRFWSHLSICKSIGKGVEVYIQPIACGHHWKELSIMGKAFSGWLGFMGPTDNTLIFYPS